MVLNWSLAGPILLSQDGKVTTLFPLEGKLSILDHQEVLMGSTMLIKSAGHILQLIAMVLIRIKAMDMQSEFICLLFSSFT